MSQFESKGHSELCGERSESSSEESLYFLDRFLKTSSPRPLRHFTEVAEALDGELTSVAGQPLIRVEKSVSVNAPYGRFCLSDTMASYAHLRFFLSKSPLTAGHDSPADDLSLEDFLFLDCETTGLATGAGTYAFLVGLGYFRTDRFILNQFFLPDYACEPALLNSLHHIVKSFKILVTYNGKCFDLPVLETRFILSRQPSPLSPMKHIDILYPARQIWRRRLLNLNLINLERQVLKTSRDGDVNSALIPSIFFHYLRTRQTVNLAPILSHNRSDLLTLAHVTLLISHLLETPHSRFLSDPFDLFGLGQLLFQRGATEKARIVLEQAWQLVTENSPSIRVATDRAHSFASLAIPIGYLLGLLHKRTQSWYEAEKIWQKMTHFAGNGSLHGYEEMAKYYEHRQHDFKKALNLVDNALLVLSLTSGSQPETKNRSPETCPENSRRNLPGITRNLEHRRQRLLRKLHSSQPRKPV